MSLLVVVSAAQMSGIAHVIVDLVAAVSEGASDHDCPNDAEGRECPPGCTSCHCVHGVGALPAVASAALLAGALKNVDATIAPYEADAPPLPDLPSVYRPPRFASLV